MALFGVRPDLGQRPHILEVPRTIPLDPGELYLQVVRQPIDDFGAPTLGPLTLEDLPADRPVEKNQLPADGERGAELGVTDPALQVLEELRVAGGELEGAFHSEKHTPAVRQDTLHCPWVKPCLAANQIGRYNRT